VRFWGSEKLPLIVAMNFNNKEWFHKSMVTKLLIANRGEIALRIIKSAKEMGVSTVAVYSNDEGYPLHAKLADEAYSLGGGTLVDTYLNIEKMLSIASRCGVDAIHPGYGFLSESVLFAEAVELAGITFIGPTPSAISTLGNKVAAKNLAKEINIPTLPSASGTLEEILTIADKIGYPMLVKPAGGGGGKGMHVAIDEAALREHFEQAVREASSSFGNAQIYIEKFVPSARHIEVQVVGDGNGNIIHLFDRECSIQRRYQKIVEEAPSPTLNNYQRNKIIDYAIALASAVDYRSAGTVEFILDLEGNIYFLEMNTRIQVEHPVTEMITGVDIVKMQLEVAMGLGLSVAQQHIKIEGCAIEIRLYAEDPENDFTPSTGVISGFKFPLFKWLRLEHALQQQDTVTGLFDPMLCKIITHGENRGVAIARMQSVLRESYLHGITSNLGFLSHILHSPRFISNNISVESAGFMAIEYAAERYLPVEVVLGYTIVQLYGQSIALNSTKHSQSVWSSFGGWAAIKRLSFYYNDHYMETFPIYRADKVISIRIDDKLMSISSYIFEEGSALLLTLDGKVAKMRYTLHSWGISLTYKGRLFRIMHAYHLSEGNRKPKATRLETGERVVISPLHGRVIRLPVKEGEVVESGSTLMIIEAMKMENLIASPQRARIGRVLVREMDQVTDGSELIVLEKL